MYANNGAIRYGRDTFEYRVHLLGTLAHVRCSMAGASWHVRGDARAIVMDLEGEAITILLPVQLDAGGGAVLARVVQCLLGDEEEIATERATDDAHGQRFFEMTGYRCTGILE